MPSMTFLVSHSFYKDESSMTSSTPEYPSCVTYSWEGPCVGKSIQGRHRWKTQTDALPRIVGRDPDGLPELSIICTLFRLQRSGSQFQLRRWGSFMNPFENMIWNLRYWPSPQLTNQICLIRMDMCCKQLVRWYQFMPTGYQIYTLQTILWNSWIPFPTY